MSDSGSEDGTGNGKHMGDIANDALTIFRINIFIIAVYLSAIALSSRHIDGVETVIDSPFTQFGFILWFGTIGSSILSYRSARLISMPDIDVSSDILVLSQGQTVRDIAGAGLGTLGVVISLAIGVYDGVYETSLPATIGLNIVAIGLILLLAFRFVFSILFIIMDILDALISFIIHKIVKNLGISPYIKSFQVRFLSNLAILLYWRKEGQIPSQEVRSTLRTIIRKYDLSEINQFAEELIEKNESERQDQDE